MMQGEFTHRSFKITSRDQLRTVFNTLACLLCKQAMDKRRLAVRYRVAEYGVLVRG